jgi:hypothetical protein
MRINKLSSKLAASNMPNSLHAQSHTEASGAAIQKTVLLVLVSTEFWVTCWYHGNHTITILIEGLLQTVKKLRVVLMNGI